MKCPKCKGENIRAFIHVLMYVDAEDSGHLTKKVLAKKSTALWYQLHDQTSYTCLDCGNCFGHGYREPTPTEKAEKFEDNCMDYHDLIE